MLLVELKATHAVNRTVAASSYSPSSPATGLVLELPLPLLPLELVCCRRGGSEERSARIEYPMYEQSQILFLSCSRMTKTRSMCGPKR